MVEEKKYENVVKCFWRFSEGKFVVGAVVVEAIFHGCMNECGNRDSANKVISVLWKHREGFSKYKLGDTSTVIITPEKYIIYEWLIISLVSAVFFLILFFYIMYRVRRNNIKGKIRELFNCVL